VKRKYKLQWFVSIYSSGYNLWYCNKGGWIDTEEWRTKEWDRAISNQQRFVGKDAAKKAMNVFDHLERKYPNATVSLCKMHWRRGERFFTDWSN